MRNLLLFKYGAIKPNSVMGIIWIWIRGWACIIALLVVFVVMMHVCLLRGYQLCIWCVPVICGFYLFSLYIYMYVLWRVSLWGTCPAAYQANTMPIVKFHSLGKPQARVCNYIQWSIGRVQVPLCLYLKLLHPTVKYSTESLSSILVYQLPHCLHFNILKHGIRGVCPIPATLRLLRNCFGDCNVRSTCVQLARRLSMSNVDLTITIPWRPVNQVFTAVSVRWAGHCSW